MNYMISLMFVNPSNVYDLKMNWTYYELELCDEVMYSRECMRFDKV